MKKIIILLGITCVGISTVNAQESNTERKNDIMLSPIELIAAPLLNISYERLLSANSGVGINGMFYLGNSNNDDYGLTQISPYYRMYFGKKYAGGFFVEGFVPITSTKDSYYDYNFDPYSTVYTPPTYNEKTRTTIGIGVGFGGKWISRNNIIFEASVGIGRRFGNKSYYDDANITGKGMLGIGYRF